VVGRRAPRAIGRGEQVTLHASVLTRPSALAVPSAHFGSTVLARSVVLACERKREGLQSGCMR